MAADEQPAPRPPSDPVPKRVARLAARPVTDPMHRRFDAIEVRLDECMRMLLEVRDRVEADLSSIVELTTELQRTLDALQRDRDGEHGAARDDATA
jgi:hypothetical protein